MREGDVEITVQRAHEAYPNACFARLRQNVFACLHFCRLLSYLYRKLAETIVAAAGGGHE
jgi:hypothetical protein